MSYDAVRVFIGSLFFVIIITGLTLSILHFSRNSQYRSLVQKTPSPSSVFSDDDAVTVTPQNYSAYVYPSKLFPRQLDYSPIDRYGSTICNFSKVGYQGQGIFNINLNNNYMPIVYVDPVSDVTESHEHIRAAMEQAHQYPIQDGWRARVHLRAGNHYYKESMYLNTSGIVLEGDVDANTGLPTTTLICTSETNQDAFVSIGALSADVSYVKPYVEVVDTLLPVGTTNLRINGPLSLQPGDRICIIRRSNDSYIHAIGMDRIPSRADGSPISQWNTDTNKNHTPNKMDMYIERKIISYNDDTKTITLETPLPIPIDSRFGGAEVRKLKDNRPANIAVINMNLECIFKTAQNENHPQSAIQWKNVIDSFANNVHAKYFTHGFRTKAWATQITVHNSSVSEFQCMSTGERMYAFDIDSSTAVLFSQCVARGFRHGCTSQSLTMGPHVFWRCQANDPTTSTSVPTVSDNGPHQRMSTSILYDSCQLINYEMVNRLNLGSGHGWVGAYCVAWNCDISGWIHNDAPPHANNLVIGFNQPATPNHHLANAIKDDTNAMVSSAVVMKYVDEPGTQEIVSSLVPTSLYSAQIY